MSNRAIILAAGRGSRMGDETEMKPKCLTQLLGRSLLSWQLESLNSAGLEDILLVGGYRNEMLEGSFKKVINKRWADTNMVASLFYAPSFNGNTIISYSDIVYHPNHIKELLKSEADITITADLKWKDLWELRLDDPLEDAESFKHNNGELYEIGKKTNSYEDIQAQYMGLIKLSENGWKVLSNTFEELSNSDKDKMDMTSMLNLLLSKGLRVNVLFINGKWCEVDNMNDKLAYEEEMKSNKNWPHDWR
jgi:L-glutamine-phosphate cytidylyltransferase